MARHNPLRHGHGAQPSTHHSRHSPRESPLRPFVQQRGSPRIPEAQSGRHTSRTPEPQQEVGGPTGPPHQSPQTRPPPTARRIIFRDHVGGYHQGPCGHHGRPASPTSDARRRPKRPRTEPRQIPTILTPTERARLVAMNAPARPTEDSASSSSNVPGPEQADELAPMHQHAPRTEHGDAEVQPHHRSTNPTLAQGSWRTRAPHSRARPDTGHGTGAVRARRPQHPARPHPRQPSQPHLRLRSARPRLGPRTNGGTNEPGPVGVRTSTNLTGHPGVLHPN